MDRYQKLKNGYVVVLVLIAITIVSGLSYAMLRSAKSLIAIERNQELNRGAREAALSGLSHALKQMSLPTWNGPASDYSMNLDMESSFRVEYRYEDTLVPGDPDYWQQPYRVNVRVFGVSTSGGRNAEYLVVAKLMLADVQLNPVKDSFASSVPVDTVTVTDNSVLVALLSNKLDFWNRIQGTTHSVVGLKLWETVSSSYRASFLTEMTGPAYQWAAPLTGTSNVEDAGIQSSWADAISILSLNLFLVPVLGTGNKYTPAGTTYQLYRGGPTYSIPQLSGKYSNEILEADSSNPWAIFSGVGTLQLEKNCIVNGTISMGSTGVLELSKKDSVLTGSQVKLPDGNTAELPAVLANQVIVNADATLQIQGMIIANTSVSTTPQTTDARVIIKGRVYTGSISLQTYKPLSNNTSSKSPADLSDYVSKIKAPAWMYCEIIDQAPQNLHWQDTSQPLLVPKTLPIDGYRWRLLSTDELGRQ